MNDFYVQDVEFGSGYNPFQAPTLLSWIAASRGFVPPDPGAPFDYCDLGCGNGRTLNGLAAVHPQSRFFGVDFNEGHIQQARDVAGNAGLTNVEFHLASFTELRALELPRFDYIGMNGIYSWLHPAVVDAVVTFLARSLAPGGLFVVEYLTLPGAAAVAPMWKLMREITAHIDATPLERAAAGIEALANLRRSNARYFVDNPRQSGLIEKLYEGRDDERLLGWLAHSALADHWHPKYFTEVSDELAAAELSFAGSAQLGLNEVELSIPPALRGAFEPLESDRQTELLKDFTLNRAQRTDVFVKSSERDLEAADRMQRDRFAVVGATDTDAARSALRRFGRGLAVAERERCLDLAGLVCQAELGVPVERLDGASQALSLLLQTDLFELLSHATFERATLERAALDPASVSAPPGAPTFALELNRIFVERAAAALEPTAVVLPNGACKRLSGLDALALASLTRYGNDPGRADFIRSTVRAHTGPIQIGQQITSADWISPGQLDESIEQFDAQRLPMLTRLGVLLSKERSGHNGPSAG